MLKKVKFILVLCLAAFAVLAGAVKESGTHFMADAVTPFIESGECPGAISVLYRNGVQETACLGWADADKKIPMGMDNIFMQCSQTKGFCGVTIAILIEEGKITLDDPVAKYLPEFKELKVKDVDADGKEFVRPAKTVLTIRMCMNHTGGFPFEIPTKNQKGWPAISVRDSAREAASLPLSFDPGTQYQYSNTGIDIGAAIVEVVTGKPWDIFLKERVLDPLEMKNSTFQPTDKQLETQIALYTVKGGEKAQFTAFHPAMPLPHNGATVHPSAGAGLWTTASDQLKFYKMLMNLGIGDNGKRILKEETVRQYLATSTRGNVPGGYSLGLYATEDGWVGHGGAWLTSCMVNWKTKQLHLWVVQQVGEPRPWEAARNKAQEAFFAAQTASGSEYTGRMN